MNLKAELEYLTPSVEPSPWRGHGHVRGYGVFGLPLSSGHTFALRVFPINDFAPYVTVWHQTAPGPSITRHPGRISPARATTVPRHIAPATIDLEWRGDAELTIRVDPQLEWTVWMHEPPVLRLLNVVSKRLPFWTWQHAPLLHLRERMAPMPSWRAITLAGRMPSGHFGVLMPHRMYLIDRARVQLAGVDLGAPVRVRPNPKIGDLPLPARGIFAIGKAHWEIRDEAEYHRTRAELGWQIRNGTHTALGCCNRLRANAHRRAARPAHAPDAASRPQDRSDLKAGSGIIPVPTYRGGVGGAQAVRRSAFERRSCRDFAATQGVAKEQRDSREVVTGDLRRPVAS